MNNHGMRVVDLFRIMDKSNSGELTRAEFTASLLKFRISLSADEMRQVADYVDNEHTDRINYQMLSRRLRSYRIELRDQIRTRHQEFRKEQIDQMRIRVSQPHKIEPAPPAQMHQWKKVKQVGFREEAKRQNVCKFGRPTCNRCRHFALNHLDLQHSQAIIRCIGSIGFVSILFMLPKPSLIAPIFIIEAEILRLPVRKPRVRIHARGGRCTPGRPERGVELRKEKG
ncbi:unnamed protein product [Protopolystoma xenopodis]|uniref:EF-hand domain-containing protein n=1 Tax=Protopolystoma xenopodis TaxID=117903 RepID=A0A3S5CBF5_9PLAT|nr:unnamed protein product [Protopolystoma xenopodis]